MFKKIAIIAAATAALTLTAIAPANAINLGGMGRSLKQHSAGSSNFVPIAFRTFCARYSGECRSGGKSTIEYTRVTRALLMSVNASVNRSIRFTDERRDVWTLNPSAGDCDDYAVSKRSKLIRAGLPANALRMAVVTTENGLLHAVLVVHTNQGDYVLDNRRSTIVKRQWTGYRFDLIATANPMLWTQ